MSKRKGKAKTISAKEKHRRKLTSFKDKLSKGCMTDARDRELKSELNEALYKLKLPLKPKKKPKFNSE